MLTRWCGWILPDAETIAFRSRVLMASTLTDVPSWRLNLMLTNTIAPRTTAIPAPIRIFLFRLILIPGGFAPPDPPTRALARRFAGALRARGSLAVARSLIFAFDPEVSTRTVYAPRLLNTAITIAMTP